ncbi:MAG TPA: DUF1566 domain-containing protein [Polyangia bacterium]|nr:DUF1566 domain-containing protein [Polyangia bacterium]
MSVRRTWPMVCARAVAVAAAAGCGSSSNAPPAAHDCGGFTMPNPASTGLPHPMAYAANADDTITDQVTGLTWEATVDGKAYMQGEAVDHCAAKGEGWRLPTRLELVSLVDYTIAAPGPTINAIFKDTPPTTFWTASAYYGDQGDDWYVGFDVGYSDYGIENQSSLVRCVRSAPLTCRVSRYQVQPNGTVYDQASGLVWQQKLDPGSYSWSDALGYCASLGAGWRVPSLTETQTIIDDGKEFPAVDATAFPDTPAEDFWTGTAEAGGSGSAWYVDFFYGASDRDVEARQFRVRCVK